MSASHKVGMLYVKMLDQFNKTQNPIYKEIADEIVAAFTVDPAIEADPGAVIFHEHRPAFSSHKILEMSSDGHEVTFSTKAYVQIAEILSKVPVEK